MSITYTLVRSSRRTLAIQITPDGEVVVRAPLRMGNKEINRFVESKADWIASHVEQQLSRKAAAPNPLTMEELKVAGERALRIIPERVEHFAPLVGVTYHNITIRYQRTRWGSCSSEGNLNFNALLALVDDELLDYVVVHELCHRKEMNHSARFWAEVERVCPDWRNCRERLKKSGLLARLPE